MDGFVHKPAYRYVVVTYPEGLPHSGEWAGFQARIHCNPTGAERHYALKYWQAVRDDKSIQSQETFLQYLAPRIVEWNLQREQLDGSIKTIPPPSEEWESFYELETDVMVWLVSCVLTAHEPDSLGKLQADGKASDSDATTTDSTPPTPIRRQNSSKRSASALRV